MGIIDGGGPSGPMNFFTPGDDPGGPRRGWLFGDRGVYGGSRSVPLLLGLLLVIAVVLLLTLL